VHDALPDGVELVDLGEHRLRDLGRPMRVFQVGGVDRRDEFPALRTLDAFPGNLPAQTSSFIGR
jgi:class 3 adenylate cyclase